jgi:hypothetical protein
MSIYITLPLGYYVTKFWLERRLQSMSRLSSDTRFDS